MLWSEPLTPGPQLEPVIVSLDHPCACPLGYRGSAQDSSLDFPAPLANALSMWPADQLTLCEALIYFFTEDGMERAFHATGILQMRAFWITHPEHCWFPLEDTQIFCGKLDADFCPPSMLNHKAQLGLEPGTVSLEHPCACPLGYR